MFSPEQENPDEGSIFLVKGLIDFVFFIWYVGGLPLENELPE